MGADVPVVRAQIITDQSQMFLDRPFADGKDHFVRSDLVFQAVALQIDIQLHRHGKGPFLFCLLLDDVQAISATVPNDVAQSQLPGDIRDPDPQIGLYYKGSCNASVGFVVQKPVLHGLDNLGELLVCERYGFLIHAMQPLSLFFLPL